MSILSPLAWCTVRASGKYGIDAASLKAAAILHMQDVYDQQYTAHSKYNRAWLDFRTIGQHGDGYVLKME